MHPRRPSNQNLNFLPHLVTGAQWLCGRVLDSRPRGRGFEPQRRHCVVSLSKSMNPSLVLVQPRKIRPFITERLLMGRKESNQTKQNKPHLVSMNVKGTILRICDIHHWPKPYYPVKISVALHQIWRQRLPLILVLPFNCLKLHSL